MRSKIASGLARISMAASRVLTATSQLFPLRDVHTLHKEPQAKRQFTDEGRDQNGGEEPIRNRGGKKQREAVRQIAHAGDLHQHTERAGQGAPSENKKTKNKALTPEK